MSFLPFNSRVQGRTPRLIPKEIWDYKPLKPRSVGMTTRVMDVSDVNAGISLILNLGQRP